MIFPEIKNYRVTKPIPDLADINIDVISGIFYHMNGMHSNITLSSYILPLR